MDNKVLLLFGLIITYVIFGFMYVAMINTLNDVGTSVNCNLEQTSYSSILGDDTNNLMSNIIRSVDCAPSWLNIVFSILTALTITTIVIVVLHG